MFVPVSIDAWEGPPEVIDFVAGTLESLAIRTLPELATQPWNAPFALDLQRY